MAGKGPFFPFHFALLVPLQAEKKLLDAQAALRKEETTRSAADLRKLQLIDALASSPAAKPLRASTAVCCHRLAGCDIPTPPPLVCGDVIPQWRLPVMPSWAR